MHGSTPFYAGDLSIHSFRYLLGRGGLGPGTNPSGYSKGQSSLGN